MPRASLRIAAVSAASALAALTLAGCSRNEPPALDRLRIAVIPKGTSHEFWKAVELGARKADADFDDVEVVFKGPAGEGDAAQQIQVVESFIADGYSGICLAPLDARALESPVRLAIGAGIPVVIFDSGLASADVPIVSYVATDNYRGGQLAGELLAKLLGGQGEVLLLPYAIGSESTEQRERGFLEAIEKFPDLAVLAKDKHGGPDEPTAVQVSENLLATYGDQVDGVFCSNESNVSGMLSALQRDPRGLAGRVKVVGFDSSANILRALEAKVLHATVLQDPVAMGYLAVKTLRAHLRGESVAKRIPTGETLATQDNWREPAVAALLDPGGAAK